MDGWQVDGGGDDLDDGEEDDGGEGCEAPNNLANRASL